MFGDHVPVHHRLFGRCARGRICHVGGSHGEGTADYDANNEPHTLVAFPRFGGQGVGREGGTNVFGELLYGSWRTEAGKACRGERLYKTRRNSMVFALLLRHSPHAPTETFDFSVRNPRKFLNSLNVQMRGEKPLQIHRSTLIFAEWGIFALYSRRSVGVSLEWSNFVVSRRTELKEHKFHIGQSVYFTSRPIGHMVANSSYEIVRLLPSDGSDYQYRIKSAKEAFERVVRESQLEYSP